MTDPEWLACDDPAAMLAWLTTDPGQRSLDLGSKTVHRSSASDRKLRLFAVACCRAVWHLLADPRGRQAVEVAERFADGLATAEELELAWARAGMAVHDDPASAARSYADYAYGCCRPDAGQAVLVILAEPQAIPLATQAALLRDVFGNPFRPIGLRHLGNALCRRCNGAGTRPDAYPPEPCPACSCVIPAVVGIARRAYDGRDFAALPVLADALEEAGCEDETLLMHLRGLERCPECLGERIRAVVVPPVPGWYACHRCRDAGWVSSRGPHARGCWALDLILGKE